MKTAEIQGIGTLEFPDDTPDEVIQAKVREFVSRQEPPSLIRQAMSASPMLQRFTTPTPGVQQAIDLVKGAGAGAWETVKGIPALLSAAASAPEKIGEAVSHATEASFPSELGQAAGEFAWSLLPFNETIRGALRGKGPTATGIGKEAGALGLAAAVGGGAPLVARAIRKAPGRHLSLPSERHATGAAMMEKIPERFGVSDASVKQLYDTAETLAAQPPVSTAPLPNFTGAVDRMNAQIARNPVPAIGDAAAAKQLSKMTTQVSGLTGGVDAAQLDSMVKAINQHLGDPTSPNRGMWKQMHGALHEDLKAAGISTGDPAFQAYAKAIEEARLNFLRQDLEEVIGLAAGRLQRTGTTGITSPGKVLNWMRDNPEWVAGVEKAKPGLLASIQNDINEIIPITNIRAASIPGAMAGSARPVLGAATGGYLAHLLGLSPQAGAELGAIFGSGGWLLEHMGAVRMSPEYIRTSFRPIVTTPSPTGAIAALGAKATSELSSRQDKGQPSEVPRLLREAVGPPKEPSQPVAGVTPSPQVSAPAAPMTSPPPADQHPGRVIRDLETGKRWGSDGTDWKEIQ